MQVVVNNLLTNYQIHGTGSKTLLFLHGWADTSQTFDSLIKNLNCKTITLDLPGFGGTQTPPQAWHLQDYAQFVADFLAKIDVEPTVIIGHSNGGSIAIYGTAHAILKPTQLVLIASAGIRERSAKKTALRLLAKPAKTALRFAPPHTQKRVKNKLYSAIGSDYLVAEHMQDTFRNIVGQDVQVDAGKIKIPVCLVYGEDDIATPLSYGKVFNALMRNSTLNSIPLSGHFVHQEQAVKVATYIKDFVGTAK